MTSCVSVTSAISYLNKYIKNRQRGSEFPPKTLHNSHVFFHNLFLKEKKDDIFKVYFFLTLGGLVGINVGMSWRTLVYTSWSTGADLWIPPKILGSGVW